MLQRKSFQTLMLSGVVILMICLLAAAISLTTQKPIDKREATPVGLPGIQVTVVNRSIPTATPKSVSTDKEGTFDLGVLPAGTYVVSLKIEASTLKDYGPGASPTLVKVTVEGTTEGTIVRGWDPKTKKAVGLTASQTNGEARTKMVDKMSPQMRQAESAANTTPDLVFTTDGKQRVKGALHAHELTHTVQQGG